MFEFTKQSYERLIEATNLDTKRFLYPLLKIGRLTGIVGARGVGKTTLLLQYIKEHFYNNKKAFYFSADSIYFNQITLLEFINDLYLTEGYRIFFIDEIHKYQNWNQELKNIYDAYPDIQIIFSGSSMLDLIKGSYDLSRRAKLYQLPGLSFREYLNFSEKKNLTAITFEDLIVTPEKFRKLGLIDRITGLFKHYLTEGYYPFVFEDKHSYHERVLRIVEKTIYEDIANFYNLKTPNLHFFKKILSYLASIPPGELNTNNIAQNMGVAHQTVNHYLTILESVGLARMIYPYEGGSQILRKPQKLFIHNTSLFHALNQTLAGLPNKGMLRELFFLQTLMDANIPLFYSKQGDYRTTKILFEIGGKNKTAKQLAKSTLPGILVRDDILSPAKNVIPLCYFGFLY